jgi:hypothetical protein
MPALKFIYPGIVPCDRMPLYRNRSPLPCRTALCRSAAATQGRGHTRSTCQQSTTVCRAAGKLRPTVPGCVVHLSTSSICPFYFCLAVEYEIYTLRKNIVFSLQL